MPAARASSSKAKKAAQKVPSPPLELAISFQNGPGTRTRRTSTRGAPVKPAKSKATPNGKTAAPVRKRTAAAHHDPPPFNALPTLPIHSRPPLQLFAWGVGDGGQLGLGIDLLPGQVNKIRRNHYVEEKIAEGAFGGENAGLEAVAAGGMHTLLIDEKGSVWSCGVNDNAALGRVTKTIVDPNNSMRTLEVDERTALPNSVPVPIQSLADEGFRAVKVAAGDSISLAISDQGELRLWGTFRGGGGLVGFSPSSQRQFRPVAVPELAGEKIVSAAAGNNHVLLLTSKGEVYTMGTGAEGQLGRRVLDWHAAHGTVPRKIVLGRRGRKAVVVGAGNEHSFAVDEEGTVWGWGINSKGQTGTGVRDPRRDPVVYAPKKVLGLARVELGGATVVEIAGGDLHTLFLTSDGRVYACGISDEGQLGLADDDPAFANRVFRDFLPEPAQVTFPDEDDPVVRIACGMNNNLAVTQGGAMYSWGRQVVGELGLGHDDDVKTPAVLVRRSGGSWAAAVPACGGQHALALLRRKT